MYFLGGPSLSDTCINTDSDQPSYSHTVWSRFYCSLFTYYKDLIEFYKGLIVLMNSIKGNGNFEHMHIAHILINICIYVVFKKLLLSIDNSTVSGRRKP